MTGFNRRTLALPCWLIFTLFSLAACGGGGGGTGNESSSAGSVSTGATPPVGTSSSSSSSSNSSGGILLAPTPTSIQLSAYAFSSAANSQSISVAMALLPASAVYFSGRYSTKGIKNVSVDWDSPNHAVVTVNFKIPSQLMPGTYSDTVQIRLCGDSACSAVIDNSTVTIPVSYRVVPPSDTGSPTVTLQQRSINVGAQTTISDVGMPSIGLVFSNFAEAPYLSATVTGAAISSATGSASTSFGQVTANLPSPQALGFGSYTGTITLKVCLDGPACVWQATGSPFQIPVSYVVFDVVNISSSDIAWDAISQRIYASENGSVTGTGYLTKFNPVTRVVDWRLPIAAAPVRLAVSTDGLYAYVSTVAIDAGLNQSDPKIRKYRLSDRTQLWAISLAGNVIDFKVSPGSGAYLAVSNVSGGLSLYNTATGALIDTFPTPSAAPENIVWGSSASVLYSYDLINDVLREFSPTNSSFGFVSNKNVNLNADQPAWSGLHYANGILMENHGTLYNVATGTITSRLDLSTDFSNPIFLPQAVTAELDTNVGRAYFYYQDGSSEIVQSFDLNTHQALAWFPTGGLYSSRMIRWGNNGLAYLDGGIALVQGTFVAP